MIKIKILVTGGSGFIGSNFIHFILNKYNSAEIINIDKLTYAGNPQNLSDIEKDSRYTFIKEDICNFEGISKVFEKKHQIMLLILQLNHTLTEVF